MVEAAKVKCGSKAASHEFVVVKSKLSRCLLSSLLLLIQFQMFRFDGCKLKARLSTRDVYKIVTFVLSATSRFSKLFRLLPLEGFPYKR